VRQALHVTLCKFAITLVVTAPALLAQPAWAAKLAFVINSSDASVSLLDVDRMVELRRVPALREPHHMALTPDGKYLLIGDTTGNELIFLDPETGEVRRRMPMSDPYQLTFSPDGKWLTVAGLARNQVDLLIADLVFPPPHEKKQIREARVSHSTLMAMALSGHQMQLTIRDLLAVEFRAAGGDDCDVGPSQAGRQLADAGRV